MGAWQPIESAPRDGTYIVGRIKDYSPVVLSWRAYTWGAAGEHRWRDCKGQIYQPVAWSVVPSLDGGWSETSLPAGHERVETLLALAKQGIIYTPTGEVDAARTQATITALATALAAAHFAPAEETLTPNG
jgi:hypothetical protein